MTRQPHALHLILDAAISRDPMPSGLQGTLAVGVVGSSGASWWQVALDGVARAGFVDAPHENATWFVLGDYEARCLAYDGKLPLDAALVKVAGNRNLIDQLAKRYLQRGSLVGVRVNARGGQ